MAITPVDPQSAAGLAYAKISSYGTAGITRANAPTFIASILSAVRVDPREDWCAAFASWAFREALTGGKSGKTFPYNAGTQTILGWFESHMASRITRNPQDVLAMPGAIYIAHDSDGSGHGHMGIIMNRDVANGTLTQMITCEGNTSKPGDRNILGAFIKTREISDMGLPYGWDEVYYINTQDIAGGSWFGP
ncbi:MAG TPA: CHAP domain-containing protein [Fimbriimonadaceae bacterium]|jgi:hypothetical protein